MAQLKSVTSWKGHKMKLSLNYYKIASLVLGVALAMLAGNVHSQQTSRPTDSRFSFDVYGDSRSMMYLPHKAGQEAEARKLMVDIFELASFRFLARFVREIHHRP